MRSRWIRSIIWKAICGRSTSTAISRTSICTFYGKIADLPAMLYENGFLQVGRSDVVNLQYVRSIRNYKVELRSGVELSVSRQYYTAIRSAWLEWKGQFGDE